MYVFIYFFVAALIVCFAAGVACDWGESKEVDGDFMAGAIFFAFLWPLIGFAGGLLFLVSLPAILLVKVLRRKKKGSHAS